jgi:hypothetical protein
MSYIVNKTSGQALVTIVDGTTDTSTGVILIGRNYTNYGVLQNENFVRLMENFAGTAPPGQSVGQYALAGQLWYNTTLNSLEVYDGSHWNPVSGYVASATQPNYYMPAGFQWWDTVNNQLYVYDGVSQFTLIGPQYSVVTGKSGTVVETIYDTLNNPHVVTKVYTNGNVYAIFSNDNFISNAGIVNFNPTIVAGLNLSNTAVVNGTSVNASYLGTVPAASYIRGDIAVNLQNDLAVEGNISTNGAYFQVNQVNGTLQVQNTNLGGSVDFTVNKNGTLQNVLHLDNTGYATVSQDPVNALGIVTKQYADAISANIGNLIVEEASSLFGNLTLFQVDIDANVGLLSTELQSLSANVGTLETVTIPTLAPLDSAALTGTPTTTTATMWANTAQVASTQFVTTQDQFILNWANIQLASQGNTLLARLIADENTFAPNASPHFTGNPTAPTPTAGDNSTSIATTAFVAGSMPYWSGHDATGAYVNSQRFISTSAPDNTQGNNGDFWFQIAS